jgi:hypothetical protein
MFCPLPNNPHRRLAPAAVSTVTPLFAPPAAAQSPGTGIEPGPCPFQTSTIPAGERIDCGFLVVPADRAALASRTIGLAVAIIRTHYPAPASDPALFRAGELGESGLDAVSHFALSGHRPARPNPGDMPQVGRRSG